ncbi:hypothetical protein DWB84_01745 [Saccharophagus sp. K07]|jgi:hypothetical protein|uniref:hypothetical protein n=1 Tax=Saccharophagus sp. K07 TaxID=2283636 RepID=UPI001652A201|nr:hypothetical protein [Saccharophagus sp. K07]MBC6904195.1 hypothetical protein [Saccharophagus sp. K07]
MENLDTTLDRMVDALVAHEEIQFLDLVQYVWRRGWPLSSAKKPNDNDALRLALKACLIERMVEIWNAPPKNSNEQVPDWCEKVPSSPAHFSVISPESRVFWENEDGSPIFQRRNIFAPRDFMFFL